MRFARAWATPLLGAAALLETAPGAAADDDSGLALVRTKMRTCCHGLGGRIVGPV